MDKTIAGYEAQVHPGFEVQPAWYDILRRSGLRKRKKSYPMPAGKMYVDHAHRIVYLHPDDQQNLPRVRAYTSGPVAVPTSSQDSPIPHREPGRVGGPNPLHSMSMAEQADRLGLPLPPKF